MFVIITANFLALILKKQSPSDQDVQKQLKELDKSIQTLQHQQQQSLQLLNDLKRQFKND